MAAAILATERARMRMEGVGMPARLICRGRWMRMGEDGGGIEPECLW